MVRYFCNTLLQCVETALPDRSEVIPLKKLLCLLLCLACCCGLLTGCGEEDVSFIYAVSGTPDTLDPQLADSDVERILAVNLFEGLFRLNAAGEPVPAACESYTVSEDGLTWTFTLRENLYYYTDPEDTEAVPVPVRAEDFAFALRRLFDRDGSSPYRQTFLDIEGAAAVAAGEAGAETLCVFSSGERTLLIRLVAPDTDLPRRLCCAGAMPCNPAFYEACEGTYGLEPKTLLGNGRFRLTLWSEENGVTLRRIDAAEGMVSKVRLVPAAGLRAEGLSPAQRLAQDITAGEFITGVPETDNCTLFSVQTMQLLFNCRNSQLADPAIRAGLAGVLYRSLPEDPGDGLSTAGGLVPDSVTFQGESWRSTAGSLLNAALPADAKDTYRQGLAALGKEKLSGITVLVPDTPEWHSLYEAISLGWQQQLSAFFSVRYLPEEEIRTAMRTGSYDIAFLTVRATQDSVAEALAAYRSNSTENPTGFADAAYDTLLTEALTSQTAAGKAAMLCEAERYLLSRWPVVPIVTLTDYFALAPGFSGVAALPFGPVLDFTDAAYAPQE